MIPVHQPLLYGVGVRAQTGVFLVAVIRDGETIPSLEPEFCLHAGDTAVVIGTQEGIRKTYNLLPGE